MIAHDFTGKSTKGFEEAVFLALYSASDFLSDMDDGEVMIKNLTQPDGDTYEAILEVTKDPLNPAYTLEEFEEVKEEQPEEIDSKEKFRIFQRKGYGSIRKLIADHFARKGQAAPSGIPDFILSRLTPADVENNVIEKEFMIASEALPVAVVDDIAPVAEEKKTEPDDKVEPQLPEPDMQGAMAGV